MTKESQGSEEEQDQPSEGPVPRRRTTARTRATGQRQPSKPSTFTERQRLTTERLALRRDERELKQRSLELERHAEQVARDAERIAHDRMLLARERDELRSERLALAEMQRRITAERALDPATQSADLPKRRGLRGRR
jgi:hypothetical protein